MKYNRIFSLLSIAAISLAMTTSVLGRSEKRGISENQFTYVQQAEALAPGVSWYYTWGNTPHSSIADYEGMAFAPMCWNANYNANAIREYVKSHPDVKYLLGFNEPNFVHQANMTPAQAAEKWPEVKALAKELGLELVAPALNYSPDTWQPIPWMDEFLRILDDPDPFDYLAIHSYGGFGVMKDLATQFHERYGKDVFVTEFCLWPGEMGNVKPDAQIASMIESVTWLEKTDWIKGYAWFKAIGQSSSSSGPNYGLILSGKGDSPRELSEQGYVYVYMSDFNPETYNPVNTNIAATEYINATDISLGKGNNPDCPRPIEITKFNSGATADYQFDVPAEGEYRLTLTVSGMGEPTRFNPCLAIYAVKEDGKQGKLLSPQKQFELSNSDEVYTSVEFPMHLEAGKQTIRIKDMYTFQPSGIRLSTLRLSDSTDSAVESIEIDNIENMPTYYTVDGIRVSTPLSPGIYIVSKEGKTQKIIVK